MKKARFTDEQMVRILREADHSPVTYADDLGGSGLGKMGYAHFGKRPPGTKTGERIEIVLCGAHIPTLCDKLEAGEFE